VAAARLILWMCRTYFLTKYPVMLVLGPIVLGPVLCLSTKKQVLVVVLGLAGCVLVLVVGIED
jgi:hypothetical protein